MFFQYHYENMNLLIVIYEPKFDLVVNVVCYSMFDNFVGVGFVVDSGGTILFALQFFLPTLSL
jgi:hypothetical protein